MFLTRCFSPLDRRRFAPLGAQTPAANQRHRVFVGTPDGVFQRKVQASGVSEGSYSLTEPVAGSPSLDLRD